MRYESQAERLRIRRELADARTDLRCASVPYPDVNRFDVQTYADVNNGMIKLLKNASYLLDELYMCIPARFQFYTRTQAYRDTDTGQLCPAGDWYLQDETVVSKRTTVSPPEADQMWCYGFDQWYRVTPETDWPSAQVSDNYYIDVKGNPSQDDQQEYAELSVEGGDVYLISASVSPSATIGMYDDSGCVRLYYSFGLSGELSSEASAVYMVPNGSTACLTDDQLVLSGYELMIPAQSSVLKVSNKKGSTLCAVPGFSRICKTPTAWPPSAYAFYQKKIFSIGFTDIAGNELSLDTSAVARVSAIQAFADFTLYMAELSDGVVAALSAQNEKYHNETYQYYYLYGFGGGYPDALSNVTRNMVFDSQYAYISTPPYTVYDYISEYDGLSHVPNVQINAPGQYLIGYSREKKGPFSPDLSAAGFEYTANEVCTVYFQISSYSAIFNEYKRCSDWDVGYVRIWKSHLLQEENGHAVKTERDYLSVLVNGAVTFPQTSRVGGGQSLPADPTPKQDDPNPPVPPVDPSVKYKIEFKLGEHGTRTGGGELTQSVEAGSSAEEPEVIGKDQWKFDGWDNEKWKNVSEDAEINAKYSEVPPEKFKIEFKLGEHGTRIGGGELEQFVESGSQIQAPTVECAGRYTFKAWDPDNSEWGNITESSAITATYYDPIDPGDPGILFEFSEGIKQVEMDFVLAEGAKSVVVGECD